MPRRAFSLIEVLIVVGILGAVTSLSVPLYNQYQIRSDLETATQQTTQGLDRARTLSQSGERDSTWGFYAPAGILYKGTSYATRDTQFDERYVMPSTIAISGLFDVSFAKRTGNPSTTGTIVLRALNNDQRQVQVSIVVHPQQLATNESDAISICHHDATGALSTITIPDSTLPTHQAHGDSIGPCSAGSSSAAACQSLYSGTTTVTYVNGQSHSNLGHVNFGVSCPNPSIVTQSYTESIPCSASNSHCTNSPGTTSMDVHSYVKNINATGFDVFLSGDDNAYLTGSSPTYTIGYQFLCQPSSVPVCSDQRIVSGVINPTFLSGKSMSNVLNTGLPSNCSPSSIVLQSVTEALPCGTSAGASACVNNPGTSGMDIHPYMVNVQAGSFDSYLSGDDNAWTGTTGQQHGVAYHAMCQNTPSQAANPMRGGTALVTYVNGLSASNATHVDFGVTCANPSIVTQSYTDSIACGTSGGASACVNNPGTNSMDVHAYYKNVTSSGFDVYLSGDDNAYVGVTSPSYTIAYQFTCLPPAATPPAACTFTLGSTPTVLTNIDYTNRTIPANSQLRCPAGYVITSIAYKDSQVGLGDMMDGMTIRCSKLESDGRLTNQTAYVANSDVDTSSRLFWEANCPANSALYGMSQKDFPINSVDSDLLDGIQRSCASFGTSGMYNQESYIGNADLDTSSREFAGFQCSGSSVLTGIDYDEYTSYSADPSATDSIAKLYCSPVTTSCVSAAPPASCPASGGLEFTTTMTSSYAYNAQGTQVSGNATTCVNTPPSGSNWVLADSECLVSLTPGVCLTQMCLWRRPSASIKDYTITHAGANNNQSVDCRTTVPAGYTLKAYQCVGSNVAGGTNCFSDACFWEKTATTQQDFALSHEGGNSGDTVDCQNTSPGTGFTSNSKICILSNGPCYSDLCLWQKNICGAYGGGIQVPSSCTKYTMTNQDITIAEQSSVTFTNYLAQLGFGNGGPYVNVHACYSTNDGSTWASIFGGNGSCKNHNNGNSFGNALQPNGTDVKTMTLAPGDKLSMKLRGYYKNNGWLTFNEIFQSTDQTGHVLYLRNGDTLANFSVVKNQVPLRDWLTSHGMLNAQGVVTIGTCDILSLTDFNDLSTSGADFQDDVMVIQFN